MVKLTEELFDFKPDIQPLVFSYEDFLSEDNEFISRKIKRNGFELTEPSSNTHPSVET